MSQVKSKPTHEIRLGNIRAAIWKNEGQGYTLHNVTLSKRYKAGDTWKETTSFGQNDLPKVVKCSSLAHDWILSNPQQLPMVAAQPEGNY